MKRETIFNADHSHRFQLWREWGMFNPRFVQFIGLNPSTANATEDDPTIRRCIGFAKQWGFGALCMTNLFTMVTPFPSELIRSGERCVPVKTWMLIQVGRRAGKIICCWGNFKAARFAETETKAALIDAGLLPFVLGLNSSGSPKHPLYLPKTTMPQPWML